MVALLAAVLCLLLTWLARNTLNPDGVSYLDLAGTALRGDWRDFVQGYWSPLYPALVALIAQVVGRDPVSLIATAHAINGVAALIGIALLWWWSRRQHDRLFARLSIGTFLLVSAGLPRIEAVTPDVVLLVLMVALAHELLPRRGERWLLTGLLLGAAFLAKTSAWPWLLLTVPLRAWGARSIGARRDVWRSSAVAFAVMLTWIVPMSVKAGHPTVGSAGRLNVCWYLDACDSRTPDTHLGEHVNYHVELVDSTHQITWADFPDGDRWTYSPWSDPTAWQAGVISDNSTAPSAFELLSYWLRQAGYSFGLWLLPVLLGVLAPAWLVARHPDAWRRWRTDDRPVLVAALLGTAGVGQFVLIHSEPRLIAPFGMLLALAVLHWLSTDEQAVPRFAPVARQLTTAVVLIGAIGFAVPRLKEGFQSSSRIDTVVSAIARTALRLQAAGLTQQRLVILGPAIPVEASAYLSGAHIVAQMPPAGVEVLKSLTPEVQQAVVAKLFGAKADIAWLTTPDAAVSIVVIPKP